MNRTYELLKKVVEDSKYKVLEDDGELIILRVIEEKGETYLEPIEDEDEFEEIGQIFEERLSDIFEFEDETEE